MKTRIVLLTAYVAIFLSQPAFTCGDSLYRVGTGVSYRIYSAPLPGNLLVYAGSADGRQLAQALAESGHEVRLVASAEELEDELRKGAYDIVIAPFEQRVTVESMAGSGASFLPVAIDSAERKLARQQSFWDYYLGK